jgi:O-antigen/teichoic acid export membrane protein
MSVSLRSATFWNAADMFTRQGGQFLVTVILARFVTPAEYGLIALLSIFTTVAARLVDGGLGSALIQRRGLTVDDESTVFWFNLGLGTLLALSLGLSAPWIAGFYEQPALVALTWAMAANVWISCWLVVPMALLTKAVDYKTQAKAGVFSIAMGGAVAVAMAVAGAGVWALATQTIVSSAVSVAAVWFLGRWKPKLSFRWTSLRALGRFGIFMLMASLLDTVATRLYSVLIGKFYSTTDLGLYNRGVSTNDFAQNAISGLLGRMALPVLSRSSHDQKEMAGLFRRLIVLSMSLNIPVMLGMAVTAPDMIFVMFGEQWLPAAPIFQILAFTGLLRPLHVANLNVLMAMGKSNLFFRLEVIKKALLISVVIAASFWSVTAIAWGTLVCSVVGLLINSYYTKDLLGEFSLLAQIRQISPYLAIGCAMAGLLLCVQQVLPDVHSVFSLLAQIGIGAAFYFMALYAFKLEALAAYRAMFSYGLGRLGRAGKKPAVSA